MSSADNEGKIEFRTQTILVQIPVVVTDKNGNDQFRNSKYACSPGSRHALPPGEVAVWVRIRMEETWYKAGVPAPPPAARFLSRITDALAERVSVLT